MREGDREIERWREHECVGETEREGGRREREK